MKYRARDVHYADLTLSQNLCLSMRRLGTRLPFPPHKRVSRFPVCAGLELETVYKCVESSDEVEVVEKEKNYQLSCFIQQEVKYMHTGIKKVRVCVCVCACACVCTCVRVCDGVPSFLGPGGNGGEKLSLPRQGCTIQQSISYFPSPRLPDNPVCQVFCWKGWRF